MAEGAHGIHALVDLRSDGTGSIVADPLGLRCIYYGENAEAFVVSSRAALVAEALGTAAQRDARGAAWLPYATYRIGDSTGFPGVHVLPAGAVVSFDRGHEHVVIGEPGWLPGEAMQNAEPEELFRVVRDDIADTFRATLSLPVSKRVVGLTGGKDSRLLLAVALWAGIAAEFEYETVGPPGAH